MENRVEIAFPILDPDIKDEIKKTLQLFFSDNTKAWALRSDATYEKLRPVGETPISAQVELMKIAKNESKQQLKPHASSESWTDRFKNKFRHWIS
jgi:polyphosphate kinase